MTHERDTESRTKMLLARLAAKLPPLDQHTTRVWGNLLDEQAKGFQLVTAPDDDYVYLTHTCGAQVCEWDMALDNLGVNQVLVQVFDHLLVCPAFNRP